MRVEGTQHCSSRHVIKGVHRINGKDGGSRVDFDRRKKDTSKSLRACSCAEPILVGEASLLKLRGKSLGKCASNEPSENIPDHQRTDSPAIRLLQSHHPANTQCRKSRPWHVCLRKPLSSAVQELATMLRCNDGGWLHHARLGAALQSEVCFRQAGFDTPPWQQLAEISHPGGVAVQPRRVTAVGQGRRA